MADGHGNGNTPLTVGEFSRWADDAMIEIREIRATQITQGQDIAVLKDRADAGRKSVRNQSGVWGSLGGLIGGILAGLATKLGMGS